MIVTVAVCTWNRSETLQQMLASLAHTRVPRGIEWEVLVVGNRCTDDTADVVAAASAALPVRFVDEPDLGLAHARNRAVREARGDYVVWTDDDVLVSAAWLEAYVTAFRAHPDAGFFGGPIRAWFAVAPPPWLERALPAIGNALSLLDLGDVPRRFTTDELPFGANFAVRADVQHRHPYDPALGRRGFGMRSGEETAVVRAILADGLDGWWVPRSCVRHHIPESRQKVSYLRRYYFNNGVSHALYRPPEGRGMLFGSPAWVWRSAVQSELLYQATRPYASPAVWGEHLRRATFAWGVLYAVRHRVRCPEGATRECVDGTGGP